MTGTPVPRKRLSARSIVPSPPRTTASSGASTPAPSSTSSTPASPAARSSRSRASPIAGRSSGAMTVARPTASADRVFDPGVELIRQRRSVALDEVEEELPVSFRSGQSRVYDADDGGIPLDGGCGDLAEDTLLDGRVSHDAARRLAPLGFELGLHEHERLPARSTEPQRGGQRLRDADERDIAGRELRCERELAELTGVDTLEHGHAGVVAEPRVELPVPDVE